MRKKDLFEQNAMLYNRLQSNSAELDKYKKLYSENIDEINQLRKQLVELEKELIEMRTSIAEEKPKVEDETVDVAFNTLEDVVLDDAYEYGAAAIGKIIVEGTRFINDFSNNPNEYSKDLINLVLGKTEVCKAGIFEVCNDQKEIVQKKSNIDAIFNETIDYFNSLKNQM